MPLLHEMLERLKATASATTFARKDMIDIQGMIGWLVAAPAFVQVGASLLFFIVIAPAILAAVAIATERCEGPLGVGVVRLVAAYYGRQTEQEPANGMQNSLDREIQGRSTPLGNARTSPGGIRPSH
jgi:hypothetical protein